MMMELDTHKRWNRISRFSALDINNKDDLYKAVATCTSTKAVRFDHMGMTADGKYAGFRAVLNDWLGAGFGARLEKGLHE